MQSKTLRIDGSGIETGLETDVYAALLRNISKLKAQSQSPKMPKKNSGQER